MTFWKWSKTAANNGTADSSCPFPEGMAPSALNDGTRGMMAAAAKFRDDIAGAIVTGGTSTAYTVSSNQVFDTLAHLNGAVIAFTPHTTNAGAVTLNVDGLGARPLRPNSTIDLPAGTIVQGTPYVAVYSDTDTTFYLHGFYGSPYLIPIGGSIDYWGATAPNSSLALMYGQAISRTTYASLFSLLGTTYGTGDGSTTFNVPDLRGRVVAGKDDMGGAAASQLTSTYYGTSAATLGAKGGGQSHSIVSGEVPSLASSGSNSISVNSTVSGIPSGQTTASCLTNASGGSFFGPGVQSVPGTVGTITSTGSNSISVSYTNNSQSQLALIQPTIIANKLIRII